MRPCVTVTPKRYAELRFGQYRIGLGVYDPTDPSWLLSIALKAISRLTDYELQHLLRADKSMREPNRKPGRPRKYKRI